SWVWPKWNRRRLLQLARDTFPVGVGHFMNALLVSVPRLVVERWLGLEALGLLTVVTYFQQAGTLVINAVSQPLINWLAKARHAGQTKSVKKTLVVLFGFALLASGGGIVFVHFAGETILGSLFGPEFKEA